MVIRLNQSKDVELAQNSIAENQQLVGKSVGLAVPPLLDIAIGSVRINDHLVKSVDVLAGLE